MSTNYRPGSEGAADQKMRNGFRIAMAAATIILLVLLFTNHLWKSNAAQTGGAFKFIGGLAFAICFGSIVLFEKITDKFDSDTAPYLVWFFSLAAALFFSMCGGI